MFARFDDIEFEYFSTFKTFDFNTQRAYYNYWSFVLKIKSSRYIIFN